MTKLVSIFFNMIILNEFKTFYAESQKKSNLYLAVVLTTNFVQCWKKNYKWSNFIIWTNLKCVSYYPSFNYEIDVKTLQRILFHFVSETFPQKEIFKFPKVFMLWYKLYLIRHFMFTHHQMNTLIFNSFKPKFL